MSLCKEGADKGDSCHHRNLLTLALPSWQYYQTPRPILKLCIVKHHKTKTAPIR